MFDLRSVSLAFQLYACEQWPPTPSIIFIRQSTGVHISTPPASHASTLHRHAASLRVYSVACIYLLRFLSAAINCRSTFLARTRQKRNRKDMRVDHHAEHVSVARCRGFGTGHFYLHRPGTLYTKRNTRWQVWITNREHDGWIWRVTRIDNVKSSFK